jgi:hypothetical protein
VLVCDKVLSLVECFKGVKGASVRQRRQGCWCAWCALRVLSLVVCLKGVKGAKNVKGCWCASKGAGVRQGVLACVKGVKFGSVLQGRQGC